MGLSFIDDSWLRSSGDDSADRDVPSYAGGGAHPDVTVHVSESQRPRLRSHRRQQGRRRDGPCWSDEPPFIHDAPSV